MSRRDGQALSPHGEETYKDLNYLNDAYKRAIIESQGQEEISLGVENSLNVSYDIQPLKMQKTKQFLGVGELGKHCKPAFGAICWSSKYGEIIGFIYLPFVVSNS